jgi:uncharacterized membrane protein YoaK (UPF0700 family)
MKRVQNLRVEEQGEASSEERSSGVMLASRSTLLPPASGFEEASARMLRSAGNTAGIGVVASIEIAPAPKRESGMAPSPKALMESDRLRVALLSAVAGYVDAAGFVSLFGLFPAHLTGEIVGLASSVSSGHPLKLRMLMVPVFIGAVAMAVVVARLFRRRGRPPLLALLGLMALALLSFTVAGFALPELGSSSHPVPVLLLSAVAAMAFQNTFMREAVGTNCPTTVMTGNLTQFVIEFVDLFILRAWGNASFAQRCKADARMKLVATALLGFSVSAALGSWLTGLVGPRSMVLPTIAVLYLAFATWRDVRQ